MEEQRVKLGEFVRERLGMGDDVGESEEAYSQLLTQQMTSAWRSNLLPRSRFLELCIFKKMLLSGLHLSRHLPPYMPDAAAASSAFGATSSVAAAAAAGAEAGGVTRALRGTLTAKPTTMFADPSFKNLWFYKSFGTGVFKVPVARLVVSSMLQAILIGRNSLSSQSLNKQSSTMWRMQ